MKKYATLAAAFLGLLVLATAAFAQAPPAGTGPAGAGSLLPMDLSSKFFGAGLTTIGAAYGIGRLAGSALESMARQPEVAGQIQTAMIIAAALIEGFTFFALFICFQG
ncbi:MAG: ATP synthase F0 subunit C [Planctomycetaceae bacterium]|nr:ATP synthase F0 subunit C [Planctomycetaceae bacterium]